MRNWAIDKIIQLNTEYGRYYSTPDGIYPSVTTVLAANQEEWLIEFRNAVGSDFANKAAAKAAKSGTRFHKFCEDFLLGRPTNLDIFDKQSFTSAIPYLKNINYVFVEKGMWSKELRVAGTIDCFGSYLKNIALIDFKTTRKQKYPGEFDKYWLQTAAYAHMVKEHTGRQIDNLIILMQNTDFNTTEIFEDQYINWIDKFKTIRNNYTEEYHV